MKPDYAFAPDFPLRRLSVDEYHRLIQANVFDEDEPTELLEGWLAWKRPKTPPRCTAVGLLADALDRLLISPWHSRHHSPITTADSEPEPDLAVVSGEPRAYLSHHPYPDQCALVVQISDDWAEFDRAVKGPIYARAGVVTYWLVNLQATVVEVYTDPTGPDAQPRYRKTDRFTAADALPLQIPGQPPAVIPVKDILP